MAEYKLPFTGKEIEEKLNKINSLVSSIDGKVPNENGNVEITTIALAELPPNEGEIHTGILQITAGSIESVMNNPTSMIVMVDSIPCIYSHAGLDANNDFYGVYIGKVEIPALGITSTATVYVALDGSYTVTTGFETSSDTGIVTTVSNTKIRRLNHYFLSESTMSDTQLIYAIPSVSSVQDIYWLLESTHIILGSGLIIPYRSGQGPIPFYGNSTLEIADSKVIINLNGLQPNWISNIKELIGETIWTAILTC